MQNITLSAGQQAAFDAIVAFLMDPAEPVFVLAGYSGTGKSTLVGYLLNEIPKINKAIKLINPSMLERQIYLTATTNPAAEVLAALSGQPTSTIHSLLGLRVQMDYSTGQSSLHLGKRAELVYDGLIVVDEASYIDSQLLHYITSQTRNCKILFMGDPNQLTLPGKTCPVFKAGFPMAMLSEVLRNAGPILELATRFRHTVEDGKWFSFVPDGQSIIHLPRKEFNSQLLQECTRPDWKYRDSKFLAWQNKTVIAYNKMIQENLTGTPGFQIGDYAICNKFLKTGTHVFKADSQVQITHINPNVVVHDVLGDYLELNGTTLVFMPKSAEAARVRLKTAQAFDEIYVAQEIIESWADLRNAFAQTINKAQGSTYNEVFIDLSDVGRCNMGEQIARMLYVGISRAKNRVWLTGDFV